MSCGTILQLSQFPASPDRLEKLHSAFSVRQYPLGDFLAQSGVDESIQGLLCTITDPIDATVLDRLPNLKVIANYGAGVNHIDRAEARKRGIVVTNTPGVLSDATADLTWGLILAVCRKIVVSDRDVRAGRFTGWHPDGPLLGTEVTGKTLGIVGMGEIGRKVARRALGFEMPVLYTQRRRLSAKVEKSLNAAYTPFEALLTASDIVSIHTPLTEETRHLFNRETLALMKPGAVLINTARGPIVDEAALADALVEGRLAGAGLDVFEDEPAVNPKLFAPEASDHVVLTAHIGSATGATRRRMGDLAIDNLLQVLQGQPPVSPV